MIDMLPCRGQPASAFHQPAFFGGLFSWSHHDFVTFSVANVTDHVLEDVAADRSLLTA